VNKGCHCAGTMPSRRPWTATTMIATETLATTVALVGTGVAGRRAPSRRFGRRLGLRRRWHDDFYLGIIVEYVLRLDTARRRQGVARRPGFFDLTYQGKARAGRGTRRAGIPIIYRLISRESAKCVTRVFVFGKGKRFTVRKSLSSRGGYRGGCGAREGEDLERRTPNRFHRLPPPRGAPGCAWERTKVMDGSVGSSERIFSLSLSIYDYNNKTRKDEKKGEKRGGV
jgi:hypothetical protein